MARSSKTPAATELKEWRRPPLWERIVAFCGLMLVLALLGYLLVEAIWGDESPPDVEIAVEEVRHNGQNFVVAFKATNAGGRTAASVLVRGVLLRNGTVIEEAEATLDYIPPRSFRGGGLFFVNDPRRAELRVGASGYSDP